MNIQINKVNSITITTDSETTVKNTDSQSAVDAVFVIGTGSKHENAELRYALRNIAVNCPFIRNVYISGECPLWVNTDIVRHLKWPDRFTHAKDANIIDKLRHACEQPEISENILFCSDDQVQTRVCTWEDFKPRWLRRYVETDTWYTDKHRIWHTRLKKTLERERQYRIETNRDPHSIYYFQPHIYMQINKHKFIDYANWSGYTHREDTIIASGYFNHSGIEGVPNFDHVFLSMNRPIPENITHIAYSDRAYQLAMPFIMRLFRKPCRYEKI